MSKWSFLERIARMYYVLGMNQQQICEQLGIGRSSVARFLIEAREKGVVQFQIRSDLERWRCRSLEREIAQSARLKDCVVFKSDARSGNSFEVLTSQYLNSVLPSNGSIGLGWGKTLYAVGAQMHLCDSRPGLKVVQLSGGAGAKEELVPATSVVQLWAQALRGKPYFLPAPAIASTVEAKKGFLSDPSIQEIMNEVKKVTVAVVGIGHTADNATIISSNLAPDLTSEKLSARCVGDVIFHFFDRDGKFSYRSLSDRVVGASPEDFLNIELRIGVAYGSDKTQAIAGALEGRLLHVLITTEETAEALLKSR